ncbi:hypothetical protein SCACP_14510 [Sporomusa carbonis]|uniref:type IV pilus modification PilV family protein n=1 Tax=Sporomusa carbonis TaxID=3076075 RepID=UPI003A7A2533
MVVVRNQRGYILLEAIIATVIVTVALVAVAGMFITSTRATVTGADYTVLTNLAQEQIETMKVKDWSAVTFPYTYIPYDDPITINNVSYTRSVRAELSDLDPEYPDKNRIIQVSATAARSDGQASVTLVTYVINDKALPQFRSP